MIDKNTEEYKFYIKDQEKDSILEEQYINQGKQWSNKYCNFLTMNLLKNFDYSTKNILDVGCREFFTYDYFKSNFKNDIAGIDVCEKGLEYTNKYNKPAVYCDAHFMQEKFKPESFDLVMSFHAMEHFYDMKKCIENFYKTLAPGGYLYFAVPIPSVNEGRGHWQDIPSESFMINLCTNIGFKKVFSRDFPAGIFRDEREMVALFEK